MIDWLYASYNFPTYRGYYDFHVRLTQQVEELFPEDKWAEPFTVRLHDFVVGCLRFFSIQGLNPTLYNVALEITFEKILTL